ncbi:MAG: ABC transporter permease [Polyangiaceae bacterium]|nr:ABC transporter permease [Polyangiaceae bacterium]
MAPASRLPDQAVPDRTAAERAGSAFLEHVGGMALLLSGSVRVLAKRPIELREIANQIEAIGVKSVPLGLITGLFVGMVMALQFALSLTQFGGLEYTGRIIGLSFSRELAPTLTSTIVGSRIAAGIAAELGSMAVTEQVDAIRALGADPIKKLVMPRLVAATLAMPMLCVLSLTVGILGAMAVCDLQFSLPAGFFLSTALDATFLADFWNGYLKTPIFGMIIALVGCHYGLGTRGGTEGVGRSTTHAVVVTSVSILLADFGLTNLYALLIPK